MSRALRVRNPNVDYTCKKDIEVDLYASKSTTSASTSSPPIAHTHDKPHKMKGKPPKSLSVQQEESRTADMPQSSGGESAQQLTGTATGEKAASKKETSSLPVDMDLDQTDLPKTARAKKASVKTSKTTTEASTTVLVSDQAKEADVDGPHLARANGKEQALANKKRKSADAAKKENKSNGKHSDMLDESLSHAEHSVVVPDVSMNDKVAKNKKQKQEGSTREKAVFTSATSLSSLPSLSIPLPVKLNLTMNENKKKRGTQQRDKPDKELNLLEQAKKVLKSFEEEHSLSKLLAAKDKQYQELLVKYDRLKELKSDELSEIIERHNKETAEIEIAKEEMINYWKNETERLKKRIAGTPEVDSQKEKEMEKLLRENAILKTQTVALHEKVQSMNKKIEDAEIALEKETEKLAIAQKELALQSESKSTNETDFDQMAAIEVYEQLTSTRITVKSEHEYQVRCVNRLDNRMIEFNLMDLGEELEYQPTRVELNGAPCPEYISEVIAFVPQEAPLFTKNLLSTLFYKA